MRTAAFLLIAAFALPLAGRAQDAPQPARTVHGQPSLPHWYDPSRDPAVDLQAAVALAQRSGKRILLEVGGDWCSWCHALEKYIKATPAVAEPLDAAFVVLKVNYSEDNKNEAFLAAYPEVPGYPHLFVLDTDGAFLHSQGTGDLEEGKSYSEAALRKFIAEWAPPKSAQ